MNRIQLFGRVFLVIGVFLASPGALAGVYDDMLNAVKRNDLGTVDDLLQRGMDVNTTDSTGNSLLMLAAQNGSTQMLEMLLRNKANIMIVNEYGDSALMLAALKGDLQSVIDLVEAGAETDPEGWTPLIYASFEGHAEVVRFLLTLDINIDAQAENGMTALMAACRNGHRDIVEILLEQKADISLADQHNLTALAIASASGNEEIVNILQKAGGK